MELPAGQWSEGYLVGLFEARGWITVTRKARYIYASLGLAMVDPEPLLAIQHVMGGKVNGPYARHGGGAVPRSEFYRQHYRLVISRRQQVDAFLEKAYRFLSPEKRSEVYIAMHKDTRSPAWEEPT